MQEKFFEACKNGDLNEVNRLLQVEGVDATAHNNFAIRWASYKGHLEVVNRLLQIEGVDATAWNNWAIQAASRNGHLEVVNRLLQIEGVDATADDNWAIRWASRNGDLEVVNRLLQDPKVRADSATLLKYLKETNQEYSNLYKLVEEMHNSKFKTTKSAGNRRCK